MVCNISYKTLIDAKPLCIRFDKANGCIRVYDGTRCSVLFGPEKSDARSLVLFGPEKYNAIYNRIRCLLKEKYRKENNIH